MPNRDQTACKDCFNDTKAGDRMIINQGSNRDMAALESKEPQTLALVQKESRKSRLRRQKAGARINTTATAMIQQVAAHMGAREQEDSAMTW